MSTSYGYSNRGFGSRSVRPPGAGSNAAPVDSLSDSGVHRGLTMGTIVRFHLWGEADPVDVQLLDINNVATWHEVTGYIKEGYDIETRPPHCMLIKAQAVRWMELIRDQD